MKSKLSENADRDNGQIERVVIPPFKRYRFFYMDEINNLVVNLKWWQKIILWFKPVYVGLDIGGYDKGYYTIMKKLGEKTIILKTGEVEIEIGIDRAV